MRAQRLVALAILTMLSFPAVAEPPPADDVVCDQCVDTSDIAARAITSNRLRNNAVRTNKIDDSAVTSTKILDGTIMPEDLGVDTLGSLTPDCDDGDFARLDPGGSGHDNWGHHTLKAFFKR